MHYIIIRMLCCLFSITLAAQTKTITVLDAQDKVPLEGVTVTFGNGKTASTDAFGKIEVNPNDRFGLSYIGYISTTIAADTVTRPVILMPDMYEINNVNIQAIKSRKINKKALPKEGIRSLVPKNYGTGAPLSHTEEIAVYIPAAMVKKGAVVKKIFFEPTDYQTLDNGRYIKHPGAKYAPFKGNVYYADAKTHEPLTPVFEEDFEVRLNEDEKHVIITLDEKRQFIFPDEGICIVVRSYTPEYYQQLGFRSAPAFDKLDVGKDNKFWQFRKGLYEGDEAEWKTEFLFATRNEIYRFDIEVEYYE